VFDAQELKKDYELSKDLTPVIESVN